MSKKPIIGISSSVIVDEAGSFAGYKRAYVNKFADNENGGFTYNFIPKTEKVKNCYISVLYVTDSELSSTELNNAVDKILNEVESYLK